MKKIILILMMVFGLSAHSLAQSSDDEYNKGEVFGGYSATNWEKKYDFAEHGFSASGVYNLHKFVGIKAEVSATFKNDPGTPINISSVFGTSTVLTNYEKRRMQNVAAGVQFKDNREVTVYKPFGHVLVGYGKYTRKSRSNCVGCFNYESVTDGTSLIVGGGFDVKINKRIDIRAVQIDFLGINRANYFQWSTAKFSSGIIFKF